ncbi:MAG: selenocysteine-specific translation elongation factor [Phycisphaerales bacterium]|jgi:selenocysteine-specific elongation factor|nr:selenocysteine-specific translation elongation factor [Phycisphaerales bacterium]MBT7171433.1 selenocysteine-specific translation elongation factor [Phycisphaerales bacterium]
MTECGSPCSPCGDGPRETAPTPLRHPVMLGTAGHVDHGKTSLVRMITGCETDRLAEEKQRGLTIELGFAPCKFDNGDIVGIVDVPGHVGFIRNMVAGAQGVDVVMLVIAADDGIMPQTYEHLDILRLMGTRFGLVVLTKTDLVSDQRREDVVAEVQNFLKGTFLEGKAICPMSNISGEGYWEFRTALDEEVQRAKPRNPAGVFGMWVERRFGVHGFGTVVSGIPRSGRLALGDTLWAFPGRAEVRVRGMEVYGRDATEAFSGQCVAMNLSGSGHDQLDKGTFLSAVKVEASTFFEADLELLPRLARPLKTHTQVQLHVGTTHVNARVVFLEDPAPLAQGARQFVQLRLESELPVIPGERYILRGPDGGMLTTLGGGRVVTVSRHKQKCRQADLRDRLTKLAAVLDESPAKLVACYLQTHPAAMTAGQIRSELALAETAGAEILAELLGRDEIVDAGEGRVVHRDVLSQFAQQAADALARYHEDHPDSPGASEAELAEALALDAVLSQRVIACAKEAGQIALRGNVYHAPGFSAGPKLNELESAVEAILREAPLTPPRPDQIADSLRRPQVAIDRALDNLIRMALAVRLDKKVVMHTDGVALAIPVVLDLFRNASHFETVEFRTALGVSRKYAVPLLDYLDLQKWTVRNANLRRIGAKAAAILNEESS